MKITRKCTTCISPSPSPSLSLSLSRSFIVLTACRTDVDCNFFVLSVDLWDAAGHVEQNLVMHPSNTSATGPGVNSPANPPNYQHSSWGPSSHAPPRIENGHYHHQGEYPPPQSDYMYQSSSNYPPTYSGYNSQASSMHHLVQHDDYPSPPSLAGSQNFTRNLIGSLTASAFRLKDDKDQLGIWFILQDLSVRTEGLFRLKFSFLNLGRYPLPPPTIHLLLSFRP